MISLYQFVISLNVIPSELELKDQSFVSIIGIALFGCFLLISFSKLLRPTVFRSMLTSNIKVMGLKAYIKESHPLNQRGSIFLLLNYFLVTSTTLFILIRVSDLTLSHEWLVVTSAPILLLLMTIGGMELIGLITGERKVFLEPMIMKYVGAQLVGVGYFIICSIWVLSSVGDVIFIQVVFILFALETTFRLLKSITVVYSYGVSWYYIILYFCTLEILPLYVTYRIMLQNFEL